MEYVYEKRGSTGRNATGWFPARIESRSRQRVETQLRFYALAFHDGDVSVDRKAGKHFYATARLRPANLKTIYFGPRADAQDFARIVRSKITAASSF